jgi:hypothetical protein
MSIIHKGAGNHLIDTFQEQESISNNSTTQKMVEWSYENEEILAEWCDIAQCYKWLDTETYKYYKHLNSCLTIPCIVFSTISGTAAFGIPNVPIEYQDYVPLFIGAITIGVGILTTVQQYYRFSELKETHRILAIAWDKLARNIRIELAKSPQERNDARHFIKFSRMEFDRLMENSEIIPDTIINKFKKIVNIETFDDEQNRNNKVLKKPDICNIIVSVNEKRRIWFPQSADFEEVMSVRSQHSKKKRKKRPNKFYTRSPTNYKFEQPNDSNDSNSDRKYSYSCSIPDTINSPKPPSRTSKSTILYEDQRQHHTPSPPPPPPVKNNTTTSIITIPTTQTVYPSFNSSNDFV